MKICITSTGETLDSGVDPRFGRCGYFIFIDPETGSFKAMANPNASATGGSGIQSAQLVATEGAEAVVTGNVGPNAFSTLATLGLKVFIGASGTIKEALEAYKAGKLTESTGPSTSSHSGMK